MLKSVLCTTKNQILVFCISWIAVWCRFRKTRRFCSSSIFKQNECPQSHVFPFIFDFLPKIAWQGAESEKSTKKRLTFPKLVIFVSCSPNLGQNSHFMCRQSSKHKIPSVPFQLDTHSHFLVHLVLKWPFQTHTFPPAAYERFYIGENQPISLDFAFPGHWVPQMG
mgnify:CR=1 FL=1